MNKEYFLKRPWDFSLALSGLVLSFPFWSLFVFLIWLEDGRPIFYLQDRVGRNGKPFKMLKFRTLGYKKENCCFAGLLRKTALDELPQLLNILKGQMSFVGPRPLIPQEINLDKDAASRLTVRPGLTGVAQIMATKDAPILEKLKYDLWYIENQSLVLDIILILKSFWISLGRKWDVVSKNP
jgi:lipopolysaccharide/colanic/teichoic acid biosynthesis glycosyltransferase